MSRSAGEAEPGSRGIAMPRRWRTLAVSATVLALLWAAVSDAGPDRYGHSDRVERHMLPAVSTGPLDPAWRPEGSRIALSLDVDGNLDIGVVSADGGPVERAPRARRSMCSPRGATTDAVSISSVPGPAGSESTGTI